MARQRVDIYFNVQIRVFHAWKKSAIVNILPIKSAGQDGESNLMKGGAAAQI